MIVIKDSKRDIWTRKLVIIAGLIFPTFCFLLVVFRLHWRMEMEDGFEAQQMWLLGISLVAVSLCTLLTIQIVASRSRACVILTAKTLAVKTPQKPTRFFKRRDCAAYAPATQTFSFEDGDQFSANKLRVLIRRWNTIPNAVFEKWWTTEDLAAIEQELEGRFPRNRWKITLFAGEGLLALVLFSLGSIGILMGIVTFGAFYLLLGAILLLGADCIRRLAWLEKQASERESVFFGVSNQHGLDSETPSVS